jgi:hypothetical protein
MTTAQLLRRILPVTAALIIVLLLAFSCSLINNDPEVPKLQNPNATFAEIGSLRLSNEEVYNELVDQFGVRVMNSILTRELLTNGPVNYIERAKNDPNFNIDEAVEETIFGVTRAKALETLSATDIRRFEAQFQVVLGTNGFDSLADFKEELYIERARELYTIDQVISTNQLRGQDIAEFYEANDYNEVCALVIRYDSLNAAVEAMRDAGLEVEDTGAFVDIPLDLPLLEAYITLYNNRYNRNVSFVDGVFSGCEDHMIYEFETLQEGNPTLANLLFRELSGSFLIDDNVGFFSAFSPLRTIPRGQEASFFLVHKISGDERNNFRSYFPDMEDLDYQAMLLEPASLIEEPADLVADLIQRVAEARGEDQNEVQSKMNQLFRDSSLTVFDPFLRLNTITTLFNVDENAGHPNVAFRYVLGGEQVSVSADQFFVELQRYAPTVVASIVNQRLAINQSDVFSQTVTRELRNSATAQVQSFRDAFFQGEYVEFGFSPQQFTWPQFIYLAFNLRSELDLYNEIITQEVIAADFERMTILPTNIDQIYDVMVDRYNDYFSINLFNLLIHRDDNNDGILDPLLDNTWTSAQRQIANEFANELRLRVQELSEQEDITIGSLRAIVTEYNNAFRAVDPEAEVSRWLPYKDAGFLLRVEDLQTVTQGMMVVPFENEARSMYNIMSRDVLRNLLSPNNIETQFGVHVIYASNYTPKPNAYPNDPNLNLPSREDVLNFESGNTEGLSLELIDFLETFYVPIRDEFNEAYRGVILSNNRASAGTLQFTVAALNSRYRTFLDVTDLQAEIRFNPRSL